MTDGITLPYDFSSSASQAYGNNLVLTGSAYCLYSGDVDQNGFVNTADILIISNAVSVFTPGYVASDINGDGICDLTDLLIAYNNSVSFVNTIRP